MIKRIYKYKKELAIETNSSAHILESKWHYVYMDEDQINAYIESRRKLYDTFEDFYSDTDNYSGVYSGRTFIRKTPYIKIYDHATLTNTKVYKNKFKKASFDVIFVEPTCSITFLADTLKAEDFIEYCKDKGLGFDITNIS